MLRSEYAVHLRMLFDEPAAALSSDEQTQQRKAILASRILSPGSSEPPHMKQIVRALFRTA